MPMHTGGLSVIPNDKGGIIDDTMITKTADKDGEHIYQVLRLHLFSHSRPVVDTRTSFRSKVLALTRSARVYTCGTICSRY